MYNAFGACESYGKSQSACSEMGGREWKWRENGDFIVAYWGNENTRVA